MNYALNKAYNIRILVFLGVLIIFSPLFFVEFPPLGNLVNHMSRTYILKNLENSVYLIDHYYADWHLIPNLLIDLFNVYFLKFLSVFLSTKILLGITLLSSISGVLLIYYSLYNRLDYWPLSIFLISYNGFIIWGFINYMGGVGLFFLTIGTWLYFEKKKKTTLKIFICTALSFLTYISHIFPFILLCLALSSYELNRLIYQKRPIADYLSTALQLFIILIFPTIFVTLYILNGASSDESAIPYWFNEVRRGFSIPLMLFYNYNLSFDIFSFLSFTLIIGVLFFTFKVRLSPLFIFPIAVLALVHAFIPRSIGSSGAEADIRIIIPLAGLFIATSNWHLKNKIINRAIFIFFAGLFLIRMALIQIVWQESMETDFVAIQEVSKKIPDGSKIAQIFIKPAKKEYIYMPYPAQYFGSLFTIYNQAQYSCQFTKKDMQPLQSKFNDPLLCYTYSYDGYMNLEPSNNLDKRDVQNADYLLVIDPENVFKSEDGFLEIVHKSPKIKFFKITLN